MQQIKLYYDSGILSTIVLMLTMRVGSVLDAGFTQILVLYNPTVYKLADVIQTYTYRIGLGQMNFSWKFTASDFQSRLKASAHRCWVPSVLSAAGRASAHQQ